MELLQIGVVRMRWNKIYRPVRLILVFLGVMLVFSIIVALRSKYATPASQFNSNSHDKKNFDAKTPNASSAELLSGPNEQSVLTQKQKQGEIIRESISSFTRDVDELKQTARGISQAFTDLLQNEPGSRIASSQVLVDRFRLYQREFQLLEGTLQESQSSLQLLESEAQRASESNVESVRELLSQITDARKRVITHLQSHRDLAEGLDRVEKEANRYPLGASLQRALVAQTEARESKLVEQMQIAERKEEERRSRELSEIAREKSELEHQLKLQREKGEIALREQEKKLEIRRLEETQRKKELEAEFEADLPKIQHYLGVLFKDKKENMLGGGISGSKKSGPVSFAALQTLGTNGLGTPEEKMMQGLLVFFSHHEAGGRGRGPYPAQYLGGTLSESDTMSIRPAYLLLQKYGLLLVEKGLLAP